MVGRNVRNEVTLFLQRSRNYIDQLTDGAETGYGVDSVIRRVKEELTVQLKNGHLFPKYACLNR